MMERREFLKILGIGAAAGVVPAAHVIQEATGKSEFVPEDWAALLQEYWYLKYFFGSEECLRLPWDEQMKVKDRYYELVDKCGAYSDRLFQEIPEMTTEVAAMAVQMHKSEIAEWRRKWNVPDSWQVW